MSDRRRPTGRTTPKGTRPPSRRKGPRRPGRGRGGVAPFDTRVVYSAGCTWWDTIDQVDTTDSGLPCCPHCGSPLYEVDSFATWWAGVDDHEEAGRPGYRQLMEWGRGRCLPSISELGAAHHFELDGPGAGRVVSYTGSDFAGDAVFEVIVIHSGLTLNGSLYTPELLEASVARYEGAPIFARSLTGAESQAAGIGLVTSGGPDPVGVLRDVRKVTVAAPWPIGGRTAIAGAAHITADGFRVGGVAAEMAFSLERQGQGLLPTVEISHDIQAEVTRDADPIVTIAEISRVNGIVIKARAES